MFIASAVDFFQAEQQICFQLGKCNPSVAGVQYVSQGIFLWWNTLPTSMKLLTINSSGCGDQSNIAFYWSPPGYIQAAWIPPNSPALAPQGELLQMEESLEQAAGGKHCPWGIWWNCDDPTETEASYYCVMQPVFESAGQSGEDFFFPVSDNV